MFYYIYVLVEQFEALIVKLESPNYNVNILLGDHKTD